MIDKRCSKCYKIKSVDEFSPRKDTPGKYKSACKSCRNKEYRAYYLHNIEEIRESFPKKAARRKERRQTDEEYRDRENQKQRESYITKETDMLSSLMLIVGIMQGQHAMSSRLNDTHPYIAAETQDYGAVWFNNSVSKGSVGIYRKFQRDIFTLKVGVVTGYAKKMTYRGEERTMLKQLFLSDNVMLMVVPEWNLYKQGNTSYDLNIVGDSLNVGISYSF